MSKYNIYDDETELSLIEIVKFSFFILYVLIKVCIILAWFIGGVIIMSYFLFEPLKGTMSIWYLMFSPIGGVMTLTFFSWMVLGHRGGPIP